MAILNLSSHSTRRILAAAHGGKGTDRNTKATIFATQSLFHRLSVYPDQLAFTTKMDMKPRRSPASVATCGGGSDRYSRPHVCPSNPFGHLKDSAGFGRSVV